MEPSLFWSSCWGQDGLRHQVSVCQGRHSSWTDGNETLQPATHPPLHLCCSLSGGTLCSSRSGGASGLREASHLDTGTGRGRWGQVHLFWILTGRQPAGHRGGCEAWAASVLQLCLSLPNPIVQQRRGGEWARPHCKRRKSRRTSLRRRWRATAASCRPAPSWRTLCSVSTHDADRPRLTSGKPLPSCACSETVCHLMLKSRILEMGDVTSLIYTFLFLSSEWWSSEQVPGEMHPTCLIFGALMCHLLQLCFLSGGRWRDYVSYFKPSQMDITVFICSNDF